MNNMASLKLNIALTSFDTFVSFSECHEVKRDSTISNRTNDKDEHIVRKSKIYHNVLFVWFNQLHLSSLTNKNSTQPNVAVRAMAMCGFFCWLVMFLAHKATAQ